MKYKYGYTLTSRMGLSIYEENTSSLSDEKMVRPPTEDVKKYKTVELIEFLQGQDLELSEATLGNLKNAEVNGHDFLLRTNEEDFTSFGVPAGPARRLADLAKELRQKKDQESANDTHVKVDANNELSHFENLALTDVSRQEDEYSYRISDNWAQAKLRELCSAKIIRVNDELWLNKKYDNVQVLIICKVTSVDHGKLAIIYYDMLPDYKANLTVRSRENSRNNYSDRTINKYMVDLMIREHFEGEKLEDISTLPELEERLLDIVKVSRPDQLGHTYRDIKIVRDGGMPISIEVAIKNHRKGWKAKNEP